MFLSTSKHHRWAPCRYVGMGLKTVIAKPERGPAWIGIPNSLCVDGDMLPSDKQT